MKKRILAITLAAAIALTMTVITAMAAENEPVKETWKVQYNEKGELVEGYSEPVGEGWTAVSTTTFDVPTGEKERYISGFNKVPITVDIFAGFEDDLDRPIEGWIFVGLKKGDPIYIDIPTGKYEQVEVYETYTDTEEVEVDDPDNPIYSYPEPGISGPRDVSDQYSNAGSHNGKPENGIEFTANDNLIMGVTRNGKNGNNAAINIPEGIVVTLVYKVGSNFYEVVVTGKADDYRPDASGTNIWITDISDGRTFEGYGKKTIEIEVEKQRFVGYEDGEEIMKKLFVGWKWEKEFEWGIIGYKQKAVYKTITIGYKSVPVYSERDVVVTYTEIVYERTVAQGTDDPTPTPPVTDDPTPTPPVTDDPTPTPPVTDDPTPTPPTTDDPTPTPPVTPDDPTPTPPVTPDDPTPPPPATDDPTPTPPVTDDPTPTPPATDDPTPTPPATDDPTPTPPAPLADPTPETPDDPGTPDEPGDTPPVIPPAPAAAPADTPDDDADAEEEEEEEEVDVDLSDIPLISLTNDGNEDGGTPAVLDEILDIPVIETPLAMIGATTSWHLWNLILSLSGIVLAIAMGIRVFAKRKDEEDNEKGNKERKLNPVLGIMIPVAAIAACILFILTQDMTAPMAMADKWTALHAGFFAAGLISFIFADRKTQQEAEENAAK